MFVGHMGLAYIAKKERPEISLWFLFTATFLIDIVEAVLEITGFNVPYSLTSHFLPATSILSVILFLIALIIYKNFVSGIIVGLLTISHTLVDYITSKMPLWANGPEIGLNLYKTPYLLFPLEVLLIVLGWNMYRTKFKTEKKNNIFIWILLIYLLVLQAIKNFIFI